MIWIPVLFLLFCSFFAFSKRKRVAILKRADYRCEGCGREWAHGYMLECHHIVPIGDGGPDEIENGEALCFTCHKQAHIDLANEALARGDHASARRNGYAARAIHGRIKEQGVKRRGK